MGCVCQGANVSSGCQVWGAYKLWLSSGSTADEVVRRFVLDANYWSLKLGNDDRSFPLIVIAFFAAADRDVAQNLAQQVMADVHVLEARSFVCLHIAM